MANNWTGRLSGNDYLYVIEKFAVRVAKSIVGGEITEQNNPYGDLYHRGSDSFSEVKAAGLSAGAIVDKGQFERHLADLERHDHRYAFVLYNSRRWEHGRWVYLPQKASKTKGTLEKFLTLNVREVHVVHISVIEAIFRNCPKKDLKCYLMQRGPKTYIRLYPGKIRSLVNQPGSLKELGLNPDDYLVRVSRKRVARFDDRTVKVEVLTIKPRPISEVSFPPVSELASA